MTEFGVDGLVTPIDSGARITGRCYDGILRVGDVFRVKFRYAPLITAGEPRARENQRIVSIKVDAIVTFHQSMDLIGAGDVAQLDLSGDDARAIEQWDVLAIPDVDAN